MCIFAFTWSRLHTHAHPVCMCCVVLCVIQYAILKIATQKLEMHDNVVQTIEGD